MNFLIAGLGNIGDEYADTRHNIGFRVLDALAKASNLVFEDKRYGFVTTLRVKNQALILLKPSTYMNLSGNAVRYWMNAKKIPLENLLVVVDDLSLPFGQLRMKPSGSEGGHNGLLPFGQLRMKPSGSEGGHNGLKHITSVLGTQQYARLRFGIGNDFPRGGQIDYVLGPFPPEQLAQMDERLDMACEMVRSFALSGIQFTMNHYNKK